MPKTDVEEYEEIVDQPGPQLTQIQLESCSRKRVGFQPKPNSEFSRNRIVLSPADAAEPYPMAVPFVDVSPNALDEE